MIKSLLQFRCDIYHLTESGKDVGYGLPAETEYEYPIQPDKSGASCYYYIVQNSTLQSAPNKELTLYYKVIFGPDEDIRFNDKITIGGIPFILDLPEKKLSSHIEVLAKKQVR